MSIPNVPLNSELAKNAPVFFDKLCATGVDHLTPKMTTVDSGAAMFAAADTRVFVRARPFLSGENDPATVVRRVPGKREVIFMAPKVTVSGKIDVIPCPMGVDATFCDNDTSEDMYRSMGEDLVKLALGGGSSSLLCYGQTGSGKTFTTSGLLSCAVRDIVASLDTCSVSVCFIEVRTEGCRCLISGNERTDVMEDALSSINIQGAKQTELTCAKQLEELTAFAFSQRSTKATGRNDVSSRSHMAIRFVITQKAAKWAQPGVLCVVDLAGSESSGDAKDHDKTRVNETKFINSSLMTLKECIRARGDASTSKKHIHIPYRRSKLTLLLRDSFELVVRRPTKTAVIACVSPLLHDCRHTYNTLRYVAMLYLAPSKSAVVVASAHDPSTWPRDKALQFLQDGLVKDPTVVLPEGDGRTMSQIPEGAFVQLCMDSGLSEPRSQQLYAKLWKAIVDGRMKHRKVAKTAREIMAENIAAAKNKENKAAMAAEEPECVTPRGMAEGHFAPAPAPAPVAGRHVPLVRKVSGTGPSFARKPSVSPSAAPVARNPAPAPRKFTQPDMVWDDVPAPVAAAKPAPANNGGRFTQPDMVWD